jgi:ribosomal protein L24E
MHTVIKIALLLTSYVAYITGTEETHTKCVSAFVGYTPSPYERKWTQHVKELQSTVCQHITNDEMTWWIGNTTAAYKDNEGSVVFTDSVIPPKAEWTEVLSVFTYKKSCVHKTDGNTVVQFAHIPIEPTAALARDPRKVRK